MSILKKMNPSKFKSAASALLQFQNMWKNSNRREDAVLTKRLVENTFLFSKNYNTNNNTCNILKDDYINDISPSNHHQAIERCQFMETKQRSNSDLLTPRYIRRCSGDILNNDNNDENKLPPISNTNSILRAASDEKIREGRSTRKKTLK